MKYPSRWEWNGLIAGWKALGKGFPSQKRLQLTETEFGFGLQSTLFAYNIDITETCNVQATENYCSFFFCFFFASDIFSLPKR